jgi:hypothetical protein
MDHIASIRGCALYAILLDISPAIGASRLTARQYNLETDDLSRAVYLIASVYGDDDRALTCLP